MFICVCKWTIEIDRVGKKSKPKAHAKRKQHAITEMNELCIIFNSIDSRTQTAAVSVALLWVVSSYI